MTQRTRAFSLTELLLAIIIIAILAAMLIPTVTDIVQRARAARAREDVAGVAKAVGKLRSDTGVTSAACLTNMSNLLSSTLVTACNLQTQLQPLGQTLGYTPAQCQVAPSGQVCWGGPYLGAISNDPWGQPYDITVDSGTWAITVISGGPDEKLGDSDDISYVQ